MNFFPLRLLHTYGLASRARNPLAAILFVLALCLPASAGDKVRIIALGDSLTAGYGLAQSDGLVAQLQRWLDAAEAGTVEVVNMGVSGDTSAGGQARLDWALGEGADAVILELGANDMLRGVDPDTTRRNLEAILSALGVRELPVLLIGMKASMNFGADYKTRFDAIYPDLAREHGTLFDPFFFAGLLDRQGMFQPDGLHPNAAGIAVVVDRLGPQVMSLINRTRQ